MTARDTVDVLNACLDRLAGGESVERCLQEFPAGAAELGPLLVLGSRIKEVVGSAHEIETARHHVFARLQPELASPMPTKRAVLPVRWQRLAIPIAAVFAMLLLTTGLLAQSSLPGDGLYPLKRLSENVGLILTGNSSELQETVNQRRIAEVESLIDLKREASVEFTGQVESVSRTEIIVAGVSIQLGSDTGISGQLVPGDVVSIEVQSTRNGQVIMRGVRAVARTETQESRLQGTSVPDTSAQSEASPLILLTHRATRSVGVTATAPAVIPAQPSSTPIVSRALDECAGPNLSEWYRYEVQPGDTLSSIASRVGSSVAELSLSNCIANASRIDVGQILLVPRRPMPSQSEPTREHASSSTADPNSGQDSDSGSGQQQSGEGQGDPRGQGGEPSGNQSQGQDQQDGNQQGRPG